MRSQRSQWSFFHPCGVIYRPNDDHVTRSGSKRVDEGAEDRNGHVGGETAAAVLCMRTLAQLHRRGGAGWRGCGHTAAVVKDLEKTWDDTNMTKLWLHEWTNAAKCEKCRNCSISNGKTASIFMSVVPYRVFSVSTVVETACHAWRDVRDSTVWADRVPLVCWTWAVSVALGKERSCIIW